MRGPKLAPVLLTGAAIVVMLVAGVAALLITEPDPVATHTTDPQVIMEVLDPSLNSFAPMWQTEIARRFPHAVGILVHGGDFVQDQWIVGAGFASHVTPATDIVKHYQAIYPDRTIVFLACNGGHLKLNIPGVYYATSFVWCVPDRSLTPGMFRSGVTLKLLDDKDDRIAGDESRWHVCPDAVGNIFEFVQD